MSYAALLRAVNVGGKNTVPMAALRETLEKAGFTRVQTLLQSGNVALDTPLPRAEAMASLRGAFAEKFGFSCGTLLFSTDEWERMVANLPFTRAQVEEAEAAQPETEHLYVYLLEHSPDAARLARLGDAAEAGDRFAPGERAIYLLCRRSVRLSKTAAKISALFPDATARNWNTVEKIRAMLTQG